MSESEEPKQDQDDQGAEVMSTAVLSNIKWAQFGQWALILGVLVWVLQVYTATLQQSEQFARDERSEIRQMYHEAMEARVQVMERLLTNHQNSINE